MSIRIAFIVGLAASLIALTACSRGGGDSGDPGSPESAGALSTGNAAVAAKVRIAARALAEPEPSVEYVAAELKGVVKARTSSQGLRQNRRALPRKPLRSFAGLPESLLPVPHRR